MKTFLMAVSLTGLLASPAIAFECPTLQAQINDETGRRFDAGSHEAKRIAAEAAKLHAEGKHAESIAKYDEAAKAAGITLTHKK
ncbi:MAG: hypothetical protein M3526_06735 [Actinomycetota bacterium]|nr:hypothetical protein [Actinomycetota bacterium]